MAHERAAHARTRVELTKLASQHAALVAQHRGKEAVDDALQKAREAEADAKGHAAAYKDLAGTIRGRYSLTAQHAICPLTGAITHLEN